MSSEHKVKAGTVPQLTNFEDGTIGHWKRGPAGEHATVKEHALHCPLTFGPGSEQVVHQEFELSKDQRYIFSCRVIGKGLQGPPTTIRFAVQDNPGSEGEFVNSGWSVYNYQFTARSTGPHTLAIEVDYRQQAPEQFVNFDYIDVKFA